MKRKDLVSHMEAEHAVNPEVLKRLSKDQIDQRHRLAHQQADLRSYPRLPTRREQEDDKNRLRYDA